MIRPSATLPALAPKPELCDTQKGVNEYGTHPKQGRTQVGLLRRSSAVKPTPPQPGRPDPPAPKEVWPLQHTDVYVAGRSDLLVRSAPAQSFKSACAKWRCLAVPNEALEANHP